MGRQRGGRSVLTTLLAVVLTATVGPVGLAADPSASPPVPSSPPASDADVFTAAPDPLTISAELSSDDRASKVIGSKGGTLKATGSDGTRYQLTIPEGALVAAVTVTMTPIDAIAGLPEGAEPEGVLGVQLEPDGLVIADPATLTMRPRKEPDPALAVLDYQGEGAETGFHHFTAEGRTITVQVGHFSGYAATFPIEVAAIRLIARYNRSDPARVLASEIAEQLATDRHRVLLGEPSQLSQVAAGYLPLFIEAVLNPLIAAAGRSCADAEAAMAAILSYQRQRQILGVGDDPAFDLPTGEAGAAGSLLNVPARLLDLKVRLCFREAHAQCVRDSDFPSMAAYFFATFKQSHLMLGIAPTFEQLELAHGYLRRCGRYRATIELADVETDPEDFERLERYGLEIELEWKPGPGDYGMVGSTVDGEAEHQDIDFAFGEAGCRHVITRTRTDEPGKASIELLEYAHRQGLPAEPRRLTLALDLGVIGFQYRCGPEPGWQDNQGNTQMHALLLRLFERSELRRGRGVPVTIRDGWRFSGPPLSAEYRDRVPQKAGNRTYANLEFDTTLQHEPG